jgi:hypothetical protein
MINMRVDLEKNKELSSGMAHFISKLVLGQADDSVHWRLVKYSKGEFEGNVIEVKARGKSIAISGSPEYEDLIGWILFRYAPAELEFKVTGSIKSAKDHTDILQGVGLDVAMSRPKGKAKYNAKIDGITVPARTMRDVYSSLMDDCNILFTAKIASGEKEWSLTTKKDYPRPSTKGELKEPDTDFCKATLPTSSEAMEGILSEVVPDLRSEFHGPFKQLRVTNSYRVNEIVLPESKGESDAAQVRILAKRKGVLSRKVLVDGKESAREIEFCI